MLERLRVRDESTRWVVAGALLAIVVAGPMVVSGPGNDLDVGNVFRSGRAMARHLSYVPSRAPGAPVHELLVGVLDRLGGPLLTNLASVAAAIGLLVALDRLLAREGIGTGRRWALAIVGANPWFLIAATSTADYVFALLFVVLAALALRADRTVLAGALAAASMGCRIGSALLVAALLLAELTEPRAVSSSAEAGTGAGDRAEGGEADSAGDGDTGTASANRAQGEGAGTAAAIPHGSPNPGRSPALGRVLRTAAVAAVVTVVLFIPSIVEAGGVAFAQNDFSTSTPLVQLGRAAVKDLTLLGPIASLVLLAAIPALWAAVKTWRTSWLVRFAVPGFVLSQVLFVRFPWKMPHLLPCLLCLAVLLAVALHRKPALLMGLAALQLVFCLVRLDVVEPDNPNQATGGKAGVSVGWGPVVTDWQCRREHPRAYLGRQKVEIEAAWDCAKPFGG